jgi:hypothetical protein
LTLVDTVDVDDVVKGGYASITGARRAALDTGAFFGKSIIQIFQPEPSIRPKGVF